MTGGWCTAKIGRVIDGVDDERTDSSRAGLSGDGEVRPAHDHAEAGASGGRPERGTGASEIHAKPARGGPGVCARGYYSAGRGARVDGEHPARTDDYDPGRGKRRDRGVRE